MRTVKLFAHSLALLALLQPASAQEEPITLMSKWNNHYRVLDCQQCFDAQGKMCHNRKYESMFLQTKSSNMGNAICCKPDSEDGYCSPSDEKHVCSSPSYDPDPSSKYSGIVSPEKRNYQMFAFCPMVNQRACGISNDNKAEAQIYATESEEIVYSKEMRYVQGDQNKREYDFCHYEITKADSVTKDKVDKLRKEATGGKVSIYFKFTKKTEMNVYAYGGKSRDTATEQLVENNGQVEINKIYSVDVDSGVLIIAYPNKDKETEFAFNYWIAPYKEPIVTPWYEFEGEQGEQLFMILCGVAALLLLCIICVCCYCCAKNRNKNKVEIVEEQELEGKSPKADGNNTSVQLEDVDDEQNLAYGTEKNKNEGVIPGAKNNEGGSVEHSQDASLINQVGTQQYPTRVYGNSFKKPKNGDIQ